MKNVNTNANRIYAAHAALAGMAAIVMAAGYTNATSVEDVAEAPAAAQTLLVEEHVIEEPLYIVAAKPAGAEMATGALAVEEIDCDTTFVIAAKPAGADMATGDLAVEELAFDDTYVIAAKPEGAAIAAGDLPVEHVAFDMPVEVRGYRTVQGPLADARR